MASYDVRFQAPLVSPATPVTAGLVMCETAPASGVVTIATAAALASAGRPLGVALISSNGIGSIDLQYTGPLLAPGFTLGAGAAGPVGIDAFGNLIRGVQANGWNVGYCTAAGLVTLRDLSVPGSAFVASPSGTGVVLALAGSLVAAASLGAAYQTLQTNSAGTNVTWGAVNLGQAAAITGLLPLGNITPGSNTQVLTTTGGVAVWAAPAITGITQLTGDVTAGPGSGSQAATVIRVNGATVPTGSGLTIGNVLQVSGSAALSYGPVLLGNANAVSGTLPIGNLQNGSAAQVLVTNAGATASAWVTLSGDATISAAGAMVNLAIHGATVPAAGALTTGNGPYVSGPSALTYSALNLAGGSGWVTGTLPAGNQAAQTMGGDCSGTTAACAVNSAGTGAIGFANGTTGTGLVTWATGTTTPGLTQASTSIATPATFTITPQASTNAAGNGGSLLLKLPALTGAGTAGYLGLDLAGSGVISATGNIRSNSAFVWNARNSGNTADQNVLTLTSGSMTLGNTGTINQLALLGFGPVFMQDGNSDYYQLAGTIISEAIANTVVRVVNANGQQLFNGSTFALGGGSGVLGIANATTQPSSAPTGGIVLTANGGSFNVYDSAGNNALISGSAVTFSASTTIATTTLSGSTGAATIALKGGGNSGSANAGAVQVAGGAASGSVGAGGAASLLGGAGGASGASAGGAITILGGASSGSSGVGGAVTITGGGSTNGAAGAILIQSGTGSGSTNASTTLSTGKGTTYGALGVVSSGNTPGVLTFLGGTIGTTQSVGGGGKSTLNVATGSFLFAPASWNGVNVQVVLCI